jgi:hypothetical protein
MPLPKNHPITTLLDHAAYHGQQPSKADLDRCLVRTDLPDGEDLNRYRHAIAKACREVADIARPAEGIHNYAEAKARADHLGGAIAGRLTETEAAIATSEDPAQAEPLADIAARMFRF